MVSKVVRVVGTRSGARRPALRSIMLRQNYYYYYYYYYRAQGAGGRGRSKTTTTTTTTTTPDASIAPAGLESTVPGRSER